MWLPNDIVVQTVSFIVPASTIKLAFGETKGSGSISTGVEISVSPTVSLINRGDGMEIGKSNIIKSLQRSKYLKERNEWDQKQKRFFEKEIIYLKECSDFGVKKMIKILTLKEVFCKEICGFSLSEIEEIIKFLKKKEVVWEEKGKTYKLKRRIDGKEI